MSKHNKEGFDPENLKDTATEPTTDAQFEGGEATDESFCEERNSDKMADRQHSEAQEWQDKYIRLSAEFDNFRKRTLKEKMELVENGGADVLRLMLATADDFDRALQHITDDTTRAGVELIYTKFLNSLKAKGVTPMEVIGQPFDVDFAEAIAKVPATDASQSGLVMDVAQKGYMIKDKVLRFAKVVVFE